MKKSKITHQKPGEMSQEEWMKELLFGYLSEDHINQKISPCPLAFLVTDIANNENEIKDTYTSMYKILNKTIQRQLKGTKNTSPTEQEILAVTALMIGGVAIGRALTDDSITKSLLESCRSTAINLLKI